MKYKLLIILSWVTFSAQAWWATPHMLVAEIAYQNLTPAAKTRADQLINIHAEQYPKANDFVSAAVWADDIKGDDNRFNSWHYVTLTFKNVNDPMPVMNDFPTKDHIAWAIEHEFTVLNDNYATDAEKGLALRRMIHWVGDIHQPLHATTHISSHYPKGDSGGNAFTLHKDAPMKNLHSLWDSALDQWFYIPRPLSAHDKDILAKEARALQSIYGESAATCLSPYDWAIESHYLARHHAYTGIEYKGLPSQAYTAAGQEITQRRITEAGLRLAAVLNKAL